MRADEENALDRDGDSRMPERLVASRLVILVNNNVLLLYLCFIHERVLTRCYRLLANHVCVPCGLFIAAAAAVGVVGLASSLAAFGQPFGQLTVVAECSSQAAAACHQ